MRIVSVLDTWEGGNGNAFLRALRRQGHSVVNLDPASFLPSGWTNRSLLGLRRALEPVLVRELTGAVIRASRIHKAHLLFVFKGRYVSKRAVSGARMCGAIAVNYFPDVSFLAHGRYLPAALPAYDWIFTTKSFGLADLENVLGVRHAEYLPHGFDPEVHAPIEIDPTDGYRYECDVSFIGTWSPKKQRLLEILMARAPEIQLRIWGAQWERAASSLSRWTEGHGVLGREYAKALVASRINLGLLSEARRGSSSGDLTTSRTFHIPATGSFMLHERTQELARYFKEGVDCAAFADGNEMASAVRYYLKHPGERKAIAEQGRARSVTSCYSVDYRVSSVIRRVQLMSEAAAL